MKRLVALALLAHALVACSTAQPIETTPVASTSETMVTNHNALITRFRGEIWPAVNTYNHHADQSSGNKLLRVTDPNGASAELHSTIEGLGQSGYDEQSQTTHYNDEMRVASVDVTASTDKTAELKVCYTYTHYWYILADETQSAPASSEATVQLANVGNTWYLRSITNDHVVPDCQSSKA